jgi:hypothetical protein
MFDSEAAQLTKKAGLAPPHCTIEVPKWLKADSTSLFLDNLLYLQPEYPVSIWKYFYSQKLWITLWMIRGNRPEYRVVTGHDLNWLLFVRSC